MLGWFLTGMIGTFVVLVGVAALLYCLPVRWYDDALERSIRDDLEGRTSRHNLKPIRSYFPEDFEKEMQSKRVMQRIESLYTQRYEQLLQQKRDQYNVSNMISTIEEKRQARKESIAELEMKE